MYAPIVSLFISSLLVGYFFAQSQFLIAAVILLTLVPLISLWTWRKVILPLHVLKHAIQERSLSSETDSMPMPEIHAWFKQVLGQLDRLDKQNQVLRSELLDRTKTLQDQNDRLRLISEELGQSYASMDDEMKVLGQLQKNLLPEDSLDLSNLSLRSFYLPNGRAGGDYFDIITNEDGETFLLIADVSGHGSPAAFIMGITRAIIHTETNHKRSPSRVLGSVNDFLYKNLRSGEFVTMFLARIDAQGQYMTFSNAGHIPPILLNHDHTQSSSLEGARWLPLGVMADSSYDETTIKLENGQRMFLCTDGLIETQDEEKKAYGLDHVIDLLLENGGHSTEECLDTLVMDLERFANRPIDLEPLEDDVTLMLIEFKHVLASVVAAPAQAS